VFRPSQKGADAGIPLIIAAAFGKSEGLLPRKRLHSHVHAAMLRVLSPAELQTPTLYIGHGPTWSRHRHGRTTLSGLIKHVKVESGIRTLLDGNVVSSHNLRVLASLALVRRIQYD
jgi:hypothetical protein